MLWDTLPDKADELLDSLVQGTDSELTDEQLQELAEKWQQPGYAAGKLRHQQRFDYQFAYRRILYLHRRRLVYRMMRYAAILTLAFGIGLLAYRLLQNPDANQEVKQLVTVKPGEMKAILRMADGREVELTGQKEKLRESNGAVIAIDSSGMRYAPQPDAADDVEIENSISIPRGGEYMLTLSDGTKIWLNADSELRYPVAFRKGKREVTVVGEAYLEVAHDPHAPFIVRTVMGSVEVLGTKFNVQAYREEQSLVTTLVEGSVVCRQEKGGKAVVLKPSQQVTIDENGIGKVRYVKSELFTGWKDGMFIFENARLEDILAQLSRWYDIRVVYTDELLKELHFSGDLSRFKDINIFFRMFEQSADITFSLKEKTLTVSRK